MTASNSLVANPKDFKKWRKQRLSGSIISSFATGVKVTYWSPFSLVLSIGLAIFGSLIIAWVMRTPTAGVLLGIESQGKPENYLVPAQILTFSFIFGIRFMLDLFNEFQSGTLDRISSTSQRLGSFIIGKAFVSLVALVCAATSTLFLASLYWGIFLDFEVIWYFLSVMALYGLIVHAIGLLLFLIMPDQASGIVSAIFLAVTISLMGGAFIPFESLPEEARIVAPLFPTHWAMVGFSEVIVNEGSTKKVLSTLNILGAYFCFLIAGVPLFWTRGR